MMDKLIKEVLAETVRLAESGPDTGYEEFVALTDLRQTLVDEVQGRSSLTESERMLLRELGQYEETILSRMMALKQEAELGMQRMNASKKQQNAYGLMDLGESIMFDKGV
jgi:hypothetical protein